MYIYIYIFISILKNIVFYYRYVHFSKAFVEIAILYLLEDACKYTYYNVYIIFHSTML